MPVHIYFDLDGTLSDPYEGIHEALAELYSRGQVMFVATSKPWQAAERIVLDGTRSDKVELLGVSYGYGSVEELRAAGAVSIAARPVDLPGLIL